MTAVRPLGLKHNCSRPARTDVQHTIIGDRRLGRRRRIFADDHSFRPSSRAAKRLRCITRLGRTASKAARDIIVVTLKAANHYGSAELSNIHRATAVSSAYSFTFDQRRDEDDAQPLED